MFGFKDWFIHSAGRSAGTIGLLLAVNLVPLLLVTAGLWDLQRVIVLYWLENGVIGLWHILRMMTAQRSALLLRLLESGFFCIHYGIFFFVHGMFVMLMLKLPVNFGNPLSLWHAIPRESLVVLMLLVFTWVFNLVALFSWRGIPQRSQRRFAHASLCPCNRPAFGHTGHRLYCTSV